MANLVCRLLARLLDGDFGEIANDRIDIASDVAHLGELGGFDFEERCISQPRQPPRDLGLSHTRRPDHQDVLGCDLVTQWFGHLRAAPAIAERDCYSALGSGLADDVLVEFTYNFFWRHHPGSLISLRLSTSCGVA